MLHGASSSNIQSVQLASHGTPGSRYPSQTDVPHLLLGLEQTKNIDQKYILDGLKINIRQTVPDY